MQAPAPKHVHTTLLGGYTMDDVKSQLGRQDAIINSIRGDVNLQAGALQRIENLALGIKSSIGTEEEDGLGGYKGTGIMGRTRRNEDEVKRLKNLYHKWIAFGTGFAACGGTALIAIWYVIGDKISIVLKGHL